MTSPEQPFSAVSPEFVEALADGLHSAWTSWMIYLFSQCEQQSDGTQVIPREKVKHWKRQMTMLYPDLTEREKQSDRQEALRLLPLIFPFIEAYLSAQKDVLTSTKE